jgi:hypothetical protein
VYDVTVAESSHIATTQSHPLSEVLASAFSFADVVTVDDDKGDEDESDPPSSEFVAPPDDQPVVPDLVSDEHGTEKLCRERFSDQIESKTWERM